MSGAAGVLKEVLLYFQKSSQTLGFAESCTGGAISFEVVQQAGVSSFYKGAIVSYAREVKEKVLLVPSGEISEFGEVSEVVALSMAKGAKKVLCSDWAVAVTGIAGPTGGTENKPLGTVCFAVVGPGIERVETKYFSPQWSRQEIQRATVHEALLLLKSYLNNK